MNNEIVWHALDAEQLSTLDKAEINTLIVGDKVICLIFYNKEWRAFQHRCPHAGVPLQDGYIDAQGNVVCPLHAYKFCTKTGYNVSGEGYGLIRYVVEVNDDGLKVGFKKGA
jgi:nitrite reductase/ring-hydroxylating ferredoxin subunit